MSFITQAPQVISYALLFKLGSRKDVGLWSQKVDNAVESVMGIKPLQI